MFRCLLIFLLIALTKHASAQSVAEGIVRDASNNPISYVTVINLSSQKGTYTNHNGYFSITATPGDSILFTFVGYRVAKTVFIMPGKSLSIVLEAAPQLLPEVIVRATDNGYLYRLFHACRKQAPKETITSKAYYELQSFSGEHQSELVECYYNATTEGYTLQSLEMKAGRFALQPNQNRYFTSIESSASLRRMNVFSHSRFLPDNPFSLSPAAFRRHYALDLLKKYVDSDGDSILVIRALPRDSSGFFFEIITQINATNATIKRIQLFSRNAKALPFRPLFPDDSISTAALHINLTYTNEPVRLQHIDFRYTIVYQSRDKWQYPVTAQAVLYCYDHDDPFVLPYFTFSDPEIGDYRRINAMPYHEAFWQNQDFRAGDRHNRNYAFYHDSNSITNVMAYSVHSPLGHGFFQHHYVAWSPDRVLIKEITDDTLANPITAFDVTAPKYNISGKLFLDVNAWNDTLHVTTRALLDPYETYYRLPMDSAAMCCINMFFDLVEIERRLLEREILDSDGSTATIDRLYADRVKHLEEIKLKFFGSVHHGKDLEGMQAANAVIVAELGIDNMRLFGMSK